MGLLGMRKFILCTAIIVVGATNSRADCNSAIDTYNNMLSRELTAPVLVQGHSCTPTLNFIRQVISLIENRIELARRVQEECPSPKAQSVAVDIISEEQAKLVDMKSKETEQAAECARRNEETATSAQSQNSVQGSTAKSHPSCGFGTSPQQCVTLEQRGVRGRWHNFRLHNSCNTPFRVPVFSCSAEWAGGCQVSTKRVGPCETTGSSSEGNQSWDRDAEQRW